MTDTNGPAPGQMQVYDAVRPPLLDGPYQLHIQTTVTGGDFPVPESDAYFSIEGPRFSLPASDVSGVHPPRNAQGTFDEVLPHIVLGRRTLPWERQLDPQQLIPDPPPSMDEMEPRPLDTSAASWLALIIFTDDPGAAEATIVPGVPLSTVITDPAIRARMALTDDPDPTVDAVEAPGPLLRRLLPTKEEAVLLSHVRRVNVDDRELAAGDTDGWFAVVMANRLPAPGHRHRACLVSLEQRTDLVPVVPWRAGDTVPADPATARLVLLHTWTFTADSPNPGGGSFRELAVALDSGLAGKGAAGLTDTGHVPLTLHDRSGSDQTVVYRGPLTPLPVARDSLGPYHGSDQARRVNPETGTEDISYAAAFELGRLLAAADPRFGQELMRWRREAYRQSARSSVATAVWDVVPQIASDQSDALRHGMVAPVSVTVLERAGTGTGPPADTTGIQAASQAPGLNPVKLASAWRVSTAQAQQLLAGEGADVPTGASPPAGDAGLQAAQARIAATQAGRS
jgi:hypothetical protein